MQAPALTDSGTPAFELPPALEAREPPEARGVPRDGVKLLVARRRTGTIEHRRFWDLPELLQRTRQLAVRIRRARARGSWTRFSGRVIY